MRAVVQRVTRATVVVDGATIGSIDHGLLVLVAIVDSDSVDDATSLVDKIADLRIFGDDTGHMNRSVVDVGGSVLVVSQFTLAADVKRGRRPSFDAAAAPDEARRLVGEVGARFVDKGIRTSTGDFGAKMEVSLVNDGPVTIIVETSNGSVVRWPPRT